MRGDSERDKWPQSQAGDKTPFCATSHRLLSKQKDQIGGGGWRVVVEVRRHKHASSSGRTVGQCETPDKKREFKTRCDMI